MNRYLLGFLLWWGKALNWIWTTVILGLFFGIIGNIIYSVMSTGKQDLADPKIYLPLLNLLATYWLPLSILLLVMIILSIGSHYANRYERRREQEEREAEQQKQRERDKALSSVAEHLVVQSKVLEKVLTEPHAGGRDQSRPYLACWNASRKRRSEGFQSSMHVGMMFCAIFICEGA